ncbi:MAG: Rne/Rng family ribonuclease [Rhizobiales bacterium]|nr:Rne/Rng family ribonuclease [Hyphomicrobiales bacterium]
MPNKMLIDATHPEETRVVVVRGNRVEEFDFESAQRKQLRGNIYLAKVTRVEPSLQAAFIEYGGNRHGFLAFSEIHPDYYQIPVADRQALIEADERAHREAEEESENRSSRRRSRHRNSRRRGHGDRVRSAVVEDPSQEAQPHHTLDGDDHSHDDHAHGEYGHTDAHDPDHHGADPDHHHDGDHEHIHAYANDADVHEHADAADHADHERTEHEDAQHHGVAEGVSFSSPAEAAVAEAIAIPEVAEPETVSDPEHVGEAHDEQASGSSAAYTDDAADAGQADSSHGDESFASAEDNHHAEGEDDDGEDTEEEEQVESVGGDDALEEVPERAYRPRRQYKIQEVIKRRQVMLVQVVKEERGNKGAALTTYLSLAGRYAVLMPNTARGGGISRKITSAQDRSRLKEVVQDLDVPEGMGIILRTAGASRTKPEIKRDFEYLIRMWETVRDMTLRSQAPTLVYEEGSLIKRSLRDLYNKEIDEVMVAGEAGYHEARDFMKMLMPSNVRAVKQYRDGQPLFSRMGVESQLDAMFSPTVQLRSGGYLVINQTEALVSIDVNSGRSTREHHIEDTALKTNLEAAEEVARQLRLRDLAGLIVIDFIDMDEKRNNRAVERKLSDCLRHDRARIQVGRISHFGLLEMSRQRIRASVLESSTEPCPHCGGTGHVRSVSSVALQLLRGLEEILMKGATHNLVVRTRTEVALYVLNHKRGHLRDLENGFKVTLAVIADPTVNGQQSYIIDRGEQVHTLEAAKALLAAQLAASPPQIEEAYDDEEPFEVEAEVETDETEGLAGEQAAGEGGESDGDGRKRKRRRRRRGRSGEARDGMAARDDDGNDSSQADDAADAVGTTDDTDASSEAGDQDADARADESADGERRPRRRGRRGGRRRRGNGGEAGLAGSIADELGPTSEPEIAEAVADFDSAPPLSEQPTQISDDEPPPQAEQSPAPQPEAHALSIQTQDDTTVEPEKAPRRRSTVREKVSFAPQPEPAPVAEIQPESPAAAQPDQPASDAAEAQQPRRAGWWSRRFGNGT